MIEVVTVPALSDNYIYLLREPNDGKTAAVDPAEAGPVNEVLTQRGWRLDYIFNTHHHGDHVGANLALKQSTGCQIVASAADRNRIPGIDIAVDDGDTMRFGSEAVQVIATPGHTLGHIVYYCPASQALFCGDTLFSLGCGRLFEGSAEQLWQSLQLLKALPLETLVYCAHEYTEANGRFALSLEAKNVELQRRCRQVAELRRQNRPTLPSTIALELATNPFLREHSREIRATIGAGNAGPADTFAKIRRLKDDFR